MLTRRVTDLPTNAAALATYGDVLLAGALLDAAWADWRAGRMVLEEVFRWQRIHGLTLRGYLRLIVGGTTDDRHWGPAGPADAGGAGPRGVGSDPQREVTGPAVDDSAHTSILPQE